MMQRTPTLSDSESYVCSGLWISFLMRLCSSFARELVSHHNPSARTPTFILSAKIFPSASYRSLSISHRFRASSSSSLRVDAFNFVLDHDALGLHVDELGDLFARNRD